MIGPTDEMREALQQARRDAGVDGGLEWHPWDEAGLSAVLALVERDYEPRRCDDPSFAGHRCTKPRGHSGDHYHRFSEYGLPMPGQEK